MNKFIMIINKIISILLIFFIVFIILNEYYVIEFSTTLKYVLYFLTLILILISSTKEIIVNKSGLSKFINCIILFSSIVGGVFSIVTNQINIFIYICILFSLIYGFIELVYKKA
ncbi:MULTISPECIES: hypothetical protein [Clostridium]|nr:hypothetical protein [Clostridium sp.]EJZ50506.1 hypothetical protein CSBG_03457 [Clostridium sp. 7_2_43FAA]MBP1869799.1 hypothetical protein [Clostridium tertium]MDU7149315.1 hypothetical protein [Clostridium sp.]MDU7243165.1 hypothetical protein [Clostridium sp.]